jgi:hypothetical protein
MIEMVYTSAARRMLDPQELEQLLAVARRNNDRLGVSGILLYDYGSFIQVLEGDEPVVRELFAHISRDQRHHRVKVHDERAIRTRSFSEWTMGFVSITSQVKKELSQQRHSLSSNGSMDDEGSASVLHMLNAFRKGRFHSYITG